VDLLSVEANCDLLLLGLTAGGGNGLNKLVPCDIFVYTRTVVSVS
jgi:hypothetical protein